MTFLNDLREAANVVEPKQWIQGDLWHPNIHGLNAPDDVKQFIALANPKTVLWLLDIIDNMALKIPFDEMVKMKEYIEKGPNSLESATIERIKGLNAAVEATKGSTQVFKEGEGS